MQEIITQNDIHKKLHQQLKAIVYITVVLQLFLLTVHFSALLLCASLYRTLLHSGEDFRSKRPKNWSTK